jgi:Skp family chaperone for outer membrane proteins
MKYLAFVSLIFLGACSTNKPAAVAVRPMPSTIVDEQSMAALRYPEAVRAYHVGRYVEPNNPLVMHENHPLYRVESMATWNLHPGPGPQPQTARLAPMTNSAFLPAPWNDSVVAELNQQKQVTRTVTQEAQRLSSTLQALNQAVTNTQEIAQQNFLLRRQLEATERRLETMEAEFRRQQSILSTITNNLTTPANEPQP